MKSTQLAGHRDTLGSGASIHSCLTISTEVSTAGIVLLFSAAEIRGTMKSAPVRRSQGMLDSVSLWSWEKGFSSRTRLFATAISA
jgi:hypothetical protein